MPKVHSESCNTKDSFKILHQEVVFSKLMHACLLRSFEEVLGYFQKGQIPCLDETFNYFQKDQYFPLKFLSEHLEINILTFKSFVTMLQYYLNLNPNSDNKSERDEANENHNNRTFIIANIVEENVEFKSTELFESIEEVKKNTQRNFNKNYGYTFIISMLKIKRITHLQFTARI